MLLDREKNFFASFTDFTLESDSSILEFCRLANAKSWQQGSEVFRFFWRVCFDSECPSSGGVKADAPLLHNALVAGKAATSERLSGAASEVSDSTLTQASTKAVVSPDQRQSTLTLEEQLRRLDLHTSTATSTAMSVPMLTPATSIADDDGVIMRFFDTFPGFQSRNATPLREEFERLAEMQSWKPKTDIYHDQFRRCCAEEFRYFCGDNTSRLEAWQDICIDMTRVSHAPPTKNQCRKVRKPVETHLYNLHNSSC